MAWTRKARIFTIAASVLLLVTVLGLAKAFKDLKQYQGHESTRRDISAAISQVNTVKSQITEQEGRQQPLLDKIKKQDEQFAYRDVLPEFNEMLLECLPNKENTPSQAALYEAFASGNVKGVEAIPRAQRKQIFVRTLPCSILMMFKRRHFLSRISKQATGVHPDVLVLPVKVQGTCSMK